MRDLICFSHLRWDFVYQRPQHLMTRMAADARVFFIEEPVFLQEIEDRWETRQDLTNRVTVLVPQLNSESRYGEVNDRLRSLLNDIILRLSIHDYILWYYAPLALAFSDHLRPVAIVYDCMDELSAFRGAPPELVTYERRLFSTADIVFTGGHRLFEAKKAHHQNIFSFPSSIDKSVFRPARDAQPDPADQMDIPHPRLGFFGVIDERFDTELVKAMAERRPDWHFVFLGPVVKIDAGELPALANIHYLGMKNYVALPRYISGWDICIMPFAINASTEFISPTKTPEFLAAGKKVISTPIHDVVHPYGDLGLVGIAADSDSFINLAEAYLRETDRTAWLSAADAFLADMSWDNTGSEMKKKIEVLETAKSIVHKLNKDVHV